MDKSLEELLIKTHHMNFDVDCFVSSAQWVGFFNIGWGRVLDKIPGTGLGLGRVGVSKYTIGYFLVSLLFSGISGISGYVGYFRVYLGLPIYIRVIF